jgi:hypothetical protein
VEVETVSERGINSSFTHPLDPPPFRYYLGSDASPPSAGAVDLERFLPSPSQIGRPGSAGHYRAGRRASEACISSPSVGGGGVSEAVEAGWALASLRRMHSARFLVTVDPVDEADGGVGGPNAGITHAGGGGMERGPEGRGGGNGGNGGDDDAGDGSCEGGGGGGHD